LLDTLIQSLSFRSDNIRYFLCSGGKTWRFWQFADKSLARSAKSADEKVNIITDKSWWEAYFIRKSDRCALEMWINVSHVHLFVQFPHLARDTIITYKLGNVTILCHLFLSVTDKYRIYIGNILYSNIVYIMGSAGFRNFAPSALEQIPPPS